MVYRFNCQRSNLIVIKMQMKCGGDLLRRKGSAEEGVGMRENNGWKCLELTRYISENK